MAGRRGGLTGIDKPEVRASGSSTDKPPDDTDDNLEGLGSTRERVFVANDGRGGFLPSVRWLSGAVSAGQRAIVKYLWVRIFFRALLS